MQFSELEENLKTFPLVSLSENEVLIKQDELTDNIYFLAKGSVKVSKNGIEIATVSDKGAVFGEMSILLTTPHTAAVTCLQDSEFYVIKHPQQYLESHPQLIWHIAQILGMRLFNLNQYLVDVKRQYEGHDHLGMVDDVLDTLLNQHKTHLLQRGDSKRETPDY